MIDSRRWPSATGPRAQMPAAVGARGAPGRPSSARSAATSAPCRRTAAHRPVRTSCCLPPSVRHDPGVLGAAAAGGVDHQAAGRRDPGERDGRRARSPRRAVPGQVDERAQVDVPGLQPGPCPGSGARTAPPPPGRPSRAGSRGDLGPSLGDLGRGRRRGRSARPAPPWPSTGLVTSSPTRSSTIRALGLVAGAVGRHRLQRRALVEVVADQLGHVAVHRLVVGDAVAGRVGQHDVAGRGDLEDLGPDRAAGRGRRRSTSSPSSRR